MSIGKCHGGCGASDILNGALKATHYYRNTVEEKRPYLQDQYCERIIASPEQTLADPHPGRMRYWGYVAELGHYLRVVVEADGETVHNAFIDGEAERWLAL